MARFSVSLAVIPGCAFGRREPTEGAGPESITPNRGYGFRARAWARLGMMVEVALMVFRLPAAHIHMPSMRSLTLPIPFVVPSSGSPDRFRWRARIELYIHAALSRLAWRARR